MGLLPYILRGTHNIRRRYTRPYTYIRVWACVYLRVMLCVPLGILGITMERRCGQYLVTNCRNVCAMLGCRCDVSAFDLWRSMCRLSKIDDRCVDLRGSATFEDGWSMCRPSKMDDQCADLRRSMVVVSTFEDRWSMWNYVATLAQNIDGIVVCELRRGFALQCFHWESKNKKSLFKMKALKCKTLGMLLSMSQWLE